MQGGDGMYAIGWLEIGEYELAAKQFQLSYSNAQQPFNVWTEFTTGGTVNFITGAGGFLQCVIFGYGGVRLGQGQLLISPPPLPQNATALTLASLHYLSSALTITVTNTTLSVMLMSQPAGAPPLQLVPQQMAPIPLFLNETVTIEVGASAIEPVPTTQ